jgi:hypothetical protein
VLASGDDFNFARFMLAPLAPTPEDVLPLDDPNTDFTASSSSRRLTAPQRERPRAGSPDARRRRGPSVAAFPTLPAFGSPSLTLLNPPLRC